MIIWFYNSINKNRAGDVTYSEKVFDLYKELIHKFNPEKFESLNTWIITAI